ncbi:hypothetical protein CC86DRAFT_465801 [Ophiobolus disseminans]|uniref:Rhodopsin domain-containing protein n=1 Tax=Ophiobolus disseminans TaxID=1469910 RepID=A0A6A7A4D7_9PLEO|nr:hypothetical protein CC86DRAFT_465801 [Ophiobolus disseminans]
MQGPQSFIAEAWTELAIGICFICLRLYFRATQVGFRGMTLDDFLVVVAGIFYVVETLAAHLIVAAWKGMGNNNFSSEQRKASAPGDVNWQHAVRGSKGHVVGWFMYTGLIWTLKGCWTIYYSRMTNGLRKMDMRIKVAWLLNGTTYLAAVCMILFKCWPLNRQWQIYPDPGNNCYPGASTLNVCFITALNTVTDIYLMAIPIPIICKAKLNLKKKISLFILFSGGWIVVIFGILRCVTLVTVPPTSPSESGQWSVRESFVAMLVSNAPMVFPLLKRWSNAALGLSSSHPSHTARSYPLDGYGSRTRENRKKSGFKHPLSIPMDTMGMAWASDEAIVKKDGEVEGEERKGGRERGVRVDGGIAILKTREYMVTEE